MTKNATPNRSIEILKAGTFTDVNGTVITFSQSDVEELVASYNADLDKAPAVIGHPKTDDPAYAWAESLAMDGDRAVATIGEIDPGFEKVVADGRYKTISPSIYPRNHAGNPTPGKYYLKHIGFLGAAKPAIKGLRPVAFAGQQNDGCIILEINLSESGVAGDDDEPENKMSKTKEDEEAAIALAARETAIADSEAALKAREAAVVEREDGIKKAAQAAIETDAMAFAESLVEKMIVPPAHKDRLAFLLTTLAGQPEDALSFGEGEAAERPDAALKSLLGSAVPVLSFGEFANPEDAPEGDNQDASDIAMRALQFSEEQAKAGTPVSAAVAVRKVMKDAAAK
jgi:hypothetical protein